MTIRSFREKQFENKPKLAKCGVLPGTYLLHDRGEGVLLRDSKPDSVVDEDDLDSQVTSLVCGLRNSWLLLNNGIVRVHSINRLAHWVLSWVELLLHVHRRVVVLATHHLVALAPVGH